MAKTLKQKRVENPNGPKGQSKYALKVMRRRKLAKKLGVADAPMPLLES